MKINPTLAKELKKADKEASRDGFGKGLLKLGKTNKNVVALTADLADSTRVEWFKKEFPDRFIECGVSEQNMAGVAAGLAFTGKIPFACSFSAFNPGRNWEQIRVSIAYSNANVKIIGSHAGITTGEDGATHQALEDIATTRCIPNMIVIVPADSLEATKATIEAAKTNGPVYIRVSRAKVPMFTTEKTPFKIGKAQIFREGKDITIIACGIMTYQALLAAEILEKEGIDAEVINCHTIKPLDKAEIIKSVKKTKAAVTAEEHQVNGGLFGAISELLSSNNPVPIEPVAVMDTFGESGPADELMKKYGLLADDIVKAVKKVLGR